MQLDHVLIAVRDLDAATATYESILGAPAAVRSEHPTYGTRNALFVFERGPYLELIATRDDGATGSFRGSLASFLDTRGEGLYGLALSPEDMAAAIERLRALGLRVPDAAHGTGVSADGRVREWVNTTLPRDAWGAFALLITHQGWNWRTDLRPPPLTGRESTHSRSIHHIVFDADDADALSREWQERFGLVCTETIDHTDFGARVLVHPAGEATVEAVSPTRADGAVAARIARNGPGLSQIAFAVSDLDGAVRAVRAAGVPIGDPAAGVLPGSRVARVDPAAAHGAAVQLLQFT
jgi:catechol 2,3-dioxygenase-like lactoylglutathione lyase family enzyme